MHNALELIEPLPLKIIAPTHGPILRDRPARYVKHYRELSTSALSGEIGDNEKSLMIFYMSSYGNTARMAEEISEGASEVDGVRVSLYDLQGGETDPFVDLIEEADALAFGSPTINGDAVKPVWDLLSSLAVVNLKGKIGGAFGSYGWSGESVKQVAAELAAMAFSMIDPGPRLQYVPDGDGLAACIEYGKKIGEADADRLSDDALAIIELLE